MAEKTVKADKKSMSLSVKKRSTDTSISDEAAENFGNNSETERQKKVKVKAVTVAKPAKRKNSTKSKTEVGKVVRDSFTMPEDDYALIDKTQRRFMRLALMLNKAEILRAGLHALEQLSNADLKEISAKVEKVKTGRPAE
jgi:hypothetical protein